MAAQKKKPARKGAEKQPRKAPKKTKEAPSTALARVVKHDQMEPAEAPMKVVTDLVHKITALKHLAGVELMYRTGELIVQKLFKGDVELVHQRGPKSKALYQLLHHDDLPFSPPTLSRSIGIYELLERSPGFRKVGALTASHLAAVLPLPAAQQDRYLQRAGDKGWTVEQLLDNVRKHKQLPAGEEEEGRKRGRPALSPGVKKLGGIYRLLFDQEHRPPDPAFVNDLDKEEVQKVKSEVAEVRAWCEAVTAAVERMERKEAKEWTRGAKSRV